MKQLWKTNGLWTENQWALILGSLFQSCWKCIYYPQQVAIWHSKTIQLHTLNFNAWDSDPMWPFAHGPLHQPRHIHLSSPGVLDGKSRYWTEGRPDVFGRSSTRSSIAVKHLCISIHLFPCLKHKAYLVCTSPWAAKVLLSSWTLCALLSAKSCLRNGNGTF